MHLWRIIRFILAQIGRLHFLLELKLAFTLALQNLLLYSLLLHHFALQNISFSLQSLLLQLFALLMLKKSGSTLFFKRVSGSLA